MIARFAHLRQFPAVFQSLTGLSVAEVEALLVEAAPRHAAAEQTRLSRPDRQRAIGGGRQFELGERDQLLLTLVWLRQYPTYLVLGFLFGLSKSPALRCVHRWLPILEELGQASCQLPQPGQRSRRTLKHLLSDMPELAVVIDSFEQRVQRPRDRATADGYYSGKKQQHTVKSQVVVDVETGKVAAVPPESVPGPTSDLTLLKQSELLDRLPPEVGAMGDLAYVGMDKVRADGPAQTPRRKPRGQPRPAEDVVYNRYFARRRVIVEHTIGRLRRFQCLNQPDRHHRQHHTPRVRAVAGLVNRQLARWDRAA
jgi:hypothetical protein